MSRTTSKERAEVIARLIQLGISYHDAEALRRIAKTLNNWFEQECGDANGFAIERDDATGKPYRTFNAGQNGFRAREPIADREAGAKKRLAAIMANYKRKLVPYIQGDCRGASVYVLRCDQIGTKDDVNSIYSRGVAVY